MLLQNVGLIGEPWPPKTDAEAATSALVCRWRALRAVVGDVTQTEAPSCCNRNSSCWESPIKLLSKGFIRLYGRYMGLRKATSELLGIIYIPQNHMEPLGMWVCYGYLVSFSNLRQGGAKFGFQAGRLGITALARFFVRRDARKNQETNMQSQ